MRRTLSICALTALLGTAQACSERAPDPGRLVPLPPLPETTRASPDAGTPSGSAAAREVASSPSNKAAEAPSERIDPSRIAEARSLLPPPLLYANFRPEVGTFVEYELSSKQAKTRVRAAVVGKTLNAEGEPLYQVEFEYPDLEQKVLVVLWVIGDERPLVDRLAVAAGADAPVSVPVDLYIGMPDLQGTKTGESEVQVKGGPFAGKATQRSYQLAPGGTAEVITTDKVPLFGVQTVRQPDGTWVARKMGTGATPELKSIPMSVPRFGAP
jgi:hypothetical protein